MAAKHAAVCLKQFVVNPIGKFVPNRGSSKRSSLFAVSLVVARRSTVGGPA
jgi:hypothetical protein